MQLERDQFLEQVSQPEVFSRASLLMTFDLLRKKKPQLALDVRNVVGGEPVYHGDDGDRNSECYRVELSSQQLREIVQGLMEFTYPNAVDLRTPEINIMARALMQDWLLLAHRSVANDPIEAIGDKDGEQH
jgi:hypothetical protein